MRKLKFSTAGNREKWNGYYDWKERTGRSSAETARQYYSEGDIAINIGTTYGEKIPSSLIGATDPDDFIKFIDKANTTSLTPPPVGKPVRFGTSGGISLNTLRHELGHSLSISVRNMEAKAIRAGIFIENELWDRWDVLYRRATPRGPNDKTAKAARVISEYSTRNADEFFAECFSMMHAEGFKEGTLDAGLGLEGVEQAVRNIVDALQ